MFYRCSLAALCLFAAAVLHAQGTITTIAGTGSIGNSGDGGLATKASLGDPVGLAVDKAGNVYIADAIFNVVRKVNSAGIISTFAGGGSPASLGDGGLATNARLVFAAARHLGLATDSTGNVYIADYGDSRIRKVDTSGKITTVAGSSTSIGLGGFSGDGGAATSAQLNSPSGIAFDGAGNMYIADFGNGRIRKVDKSGIITTVAGMGNGGSDSGDGGPAIDALLTSISDVAADSKGNIFIADEEHIREVNSSGIISTAAHGFFGTCAPNPAPAANSDVAANGLATDSAGNLFIADKSGGCIQELETNATVSTVAGGGTNLNGDGGPATDASIVPAAVAVDSGGNLYIADGNKVRKVTSSVTPPSQEPTISSEGVVNGASFTVGIAPNAFATITGKNFTNADAGWTVKNGILPTSLDGVSVTIGGLPAYVSFISPTQVNVLVPPNLSDEFPTVVVKNAAGSSAPATVLSSPYMPGYFLWPNNQVVASHLDFTLAAKDGTFAGTKTVPAKPGETIVLWGTGFGPTSPAIPVGTTVPSDKTYSTTTLPTIELNLVQAKVFGAALAPGFAGLYQIAFEVPASLSDGDYQVFTTIAGAVAADVPILTVKQ